MEEAAQQLLRALRGRRSQVAFARRLGYKRNPISDWENGRRAPHAVETLRAAQIAGVDLDAAFRAFATPDAPLPESYDREGLSAWLRGLRGASPIRDIAQKAGVTRFAVSRWLSGATNTRLPDFLRLLDALTGRCSDWVAQLVDIEQVPALLESYRRRSAQRALAAEVPWAVAVLRLLETTDYRSLPAHRPGWLAARLGLAPEEEVRCLEALEDAGVIRWRTTHYRTAAPLTVDARNRPDLVTALKVHWASVAAERARAPRPQDLFSYNVISLSRRDLERLEALHLAYYRDVRSLVAASEPVEVAALVNVQLVTFDTE